MGETSTVQFKQMFRTAEDVANEIVAFSNSHGGSILIGINDKTGEIVGLDFNQLHETGSLIANAADSRVHPAVYPIVETVSVDGKAVMVVTVAKGTDAPYTNNRGEIYVKQGPDKRRVTENNEILRLFYDCGNFQPDSRPIRGTAISDINIRALDDYFRRSLGKSSDEIEIPFSKALQNLSIIDKNGELTLAGLMYFGKHPQKFCPSFIIKAVWFVGNSIGGSEYHDSRDIDGTIPEMFDYGMRFLESCLHRVQSGQNFNSVGILEIPEVALREILQNALTHRSWLTPAPIRLLVFDNRVEIISPGALPNNLTVDDIKLGNAYQRNQLIANLCAKTMDYRGLGSGIIRALGADSNIEFHNETGGDQFRVILWRREVESKEKSKEKTDPEVESKEKSKEKTDPEVESKEKSKEKIGPEIDSKENVILLIRNNPLITTSEMSGALGLSRSGVEKIIRFLKVSGRIRRIGPDKGGYWEIIE